MPRAPYQILVLPFRRNGDGEIFYAIFRRSDDGYWQGIAGGGENDETPAEAARREAFEEAGIPDDAPFIALDSICSIPVAHFADGGIRGGDLLVIPEYSFGVDATDVKCVLSTEHSEMRWSTYDDAMSRLQWDSNRTALWELHQRLLRQQPE